MPEPRYLLAAALLVALTLAPLTGWPFGNVAAYAQVSRTGDSAVRTVAHSNENERQDREDRRGRNQNDQDDNDDGEDWEPLPPPIRHDLEPAAPPPDRVGRCIGSGGTVTLGLPGGTATFTGYQDGLYSEIERVDPASVTSPGNLVGQLLFRVAVSPCGGGGLSLLASEANLGVGYADAAAAGGDESKLALLFFDGQRWSPAPKQATDPPHNYVSATISTPGIYALVQQ